MSETPTTPTTPEAVTEVPGDADEKVATGYAVYDQTIGQFVPGVEKEKPTRSQADKRVPKGHTAAIVRV